MREKEKVHLTGQLKLYMQFPAVMAILLIGINLGIYRMNQKAGTILFIFVLIYVVMVGMMYFYTKSIVTVSYTHLTLPTILRV